MKRNKVGKASAEERKTIKIDPKVHKLADVLSSKIGVPLYELAEYGLTRLIDDMQNTEYEEDVVAIKMAWEDGDKTEDYNSFLIRQFSTSGDLELPSEKRKRAEIANWLEDHPTTPGIPLLTATATDGDNQNDDSSGTGESSGVRASGDTMHDSGIPADVDREWLARLLKVIDERPGGTNSGAGTSSKPSGPKGLAGKAAEIRRDTREFDANPRRAHRKGKDRRA